MKAPPGYFQGILQLRPATEEIIDFLEHELEVNKRFIVTRQKVLKKGNLDLYVTDQRVLRALGLKLNRRFTGVLKSSRTLFTKNRSTSKEVYRVTLVFKPLPLKKGAELKHEGKTYIIHQYNNTSAILKDPVSGKKTRVKLDDLVSFK